MDITNFSYVRRGGAIFVSVIRLKNAPCEFTQYHISYGVAVLYTDRAIRKAVLEHARIRCKTPTKAEAKFGKKQLCKRGKLVVDVYEQRNGYAIHIAMVTKEAERWLILPEEQCLMKRWWFRKTRSREVPTTLDSKPTLRH